MAETTNSAPQKNKKSVVSNIVLGIVVVVSLSLAIFSVTQLIGNHRRATNDKEFKKITTTLENPEALYNAAKAESSPNSELKKADYKNSPAIDTLLKNTAAVLNGKSTKEVIADQKLAATRQAVNGTLVAAYGSMGQEAGTPVYSYNVVTRDVSIDKSTPRYDKFMAEVAKALEEACDKDNGKCTEKKDGKSPKHVYYTISIGQFPENKLAFRLYINTLIVY